MVYVIYNSYELNVLVSCVKFVTFVDILEHKDILIGNKNLSNLWINRSSPKHANHFVVLLFVNCIEVVFECCLVACMDLLLTL